MAFADPGTDRGIWKPRAATPEKVQLAEACKVGDVLGNDDSTWKRALATTGSVNQGKRVALEEGASGDIIETSENAVVVGFSGGTPGAFIYVAEGSDNGKITETKPTDTGDADTIVGVVLAASVVVFFFGSRPASLAT